MTPLSELYEVTKYWLPLLTIGSLVVRAWHKAKTGVESWASALLHNHLSHIQESLTNIEQHLAKLVEKL